MKHPKQPRNRARLAAGLIASCSLALGGLTHELGPQTAMAADSKILPGHTCAPEREDVWTSRVDPRFLQNILNGNQTYMCPIVRDHSTGELDFVRVRVENVGLETDALALPVCTVHSVSVSGTLTDSESDSAPPVEGFHDLEFSLNGFTEPDNGHYVIECALGPGDRIISYRAAEN